MWCYRLRPLALKLSSIGTPLSNSFVPLQIVLRFQLKFTPLFWPKPLDKAQVF